MGFEEQTARIERLICLIDSTKTGNASELAKKVGVSRRTLFRDLDFLKGKGLQIVFCHTDRSFKFATN
jgi:predicted DNA-binding transcriptional regulator YafY